MVVLVLPMTVVLVAVVGAVAVPVPMPVPMALLFRTVAVAVALLPACIVFVAVVVVDELGKLGVDLGLDAFEVEAADVDDLVDLKEKKKKKKKKKRESGIPSDCNHQSAPNKHGHSEKKMVTRRVLGGTELANTWKWPQNTIN